MSIKECCGLGRCVVTKGLQDCSSCKAISYCGREHQIEHFKSGHKLVCPGREKPIAFAACVEKATRYYNDKMWVAALPYYSALLELIERGSDIFHPQTILALEGMAKCYKQMEKLDECIQCLQRIVLILEMSNVEESPANNEKMFTTMGHMAELYMLSGQTAIAKELLSKIEISALEAFGDESFERGRALMALAGCQDLIGEVVEAEATLVKAISLPGYGSCTIDTKKAVASNGYFNLGVILFKQNKFAAALPHFESALEFKIRGKVDPEDPDMLETKKYIVESKKGCA